jgi:ABC-type uncharacterized transport system permease subunit
VHFCQREPCLCLSSGFDSRSSSTALPPSRFCLPRSTVGPAGDISPCPQRSQAFSFTSSVAFLLLAVRYHTVVFGIFLLPAAALLAIIPAFHPGHEVIAYPLIRTGWLLLHVGLLLAAYAALFLSLVASLLYLIQERRLKLKRAPRTGFFETRLPPLATLDQIALNALLFGLPCMTAGLLIGSVVALQTTGPTFFADPKVLLSVAMWIAYIAMIFIRRHAGLRGRRAVYLSSFVFLGVLAVWAANALSTVHRFKAP